MAIAIGIDVGATKIAAGLVHRNGKVLAHDRSATPQTSPDALVEALAESVQRILEKTATEARDLVGIGVGAPGPVAFPEGDVLAFTNIPISGFPLRARLQEALGVRTLLDNDGNLAALGEKKFGAGKAASNLVCIVVGTGVGGGIITNNVLYRGSRGGAGEIGHMVIGVGGPRCGCGNYGCLESFIAGYAIARYARDLLEMDRAQTSSMWQAIDGNLQALEPSHVTEAAEAGDKLARDVYEHVGTFLGIGIANLVNLLNPELVVIGGGITAAAKDLLIQPAKREAGARALRHSAELARIVPAQLGNDAGILGAAALVL